MVQHPPTVVTVNVATMLQGVVVQDWFGCQLDRQAAAAFRVAALKPPLPSLPAHFSSTRNKISVLAHSSRLHQKEPVESEDISVIMSSAQYWPMKVVSNPIINVGIGKSPVVVPC